MQRLAALIAGILALIVATWFLGWMVVTINAYPLWIIILAVIGMMIFDFYQSLREEVGNGNGGNGASST